MGKKNKVLSKIKSKHNSVAGSYPFINPIIVGNDNGIIDGQIRFTVCKQQNLPVNYIVMNYSSNDLHNKNFTEEIMSIKEQQKRNLEQFFAKNNIGYLDQLSQCSSTDRMRKFIEFENQFKSDEEYWKKLGECYVSSDNNYALSSEINRLFRSKRNNREHLMNLEERNLLYNLPETITIYRGMSLTESEGNEFGISWTLKRELAQKYGDGFIHNYDTKHIPHTVKELTINKKDVVAYFTTRNEEEIIYIGN